MESAKQSNKISDIVRLKQRLKKWRNQAHNAQTEASSTAIKTNDSINNNSGNSNSNGNNSSNTKKGSLSRSNSIKGITFLKRRTLSMADFSFSSGVPSNGFPPMDEARSNNSNSGSSSSSSSSNTKSNGSKGMTFLKRTLSFTDISSNSGVPSNGFPPMNEARSNKSNTNSSSNSKSNGSKGINFLKRTLSFTDVTPVSNNNVPKGFLAVHVGVEMKRFVIPTNYLGHQAFCTLLQEAEDEFGFQQEGVLRIPCEVEVFEAILRGVEEKNSSNSKQGYQFNRNDGIVCGSIESQSLSHSHRPPSPMCR